MMISKLEMTYKKNAAMAYAELSFWHLNGVTQEN